MDFDTGPGILDLPPIDPKERLQALGPGKPKMCFKHSHSFRKPLMQIWVFAADAGLTECLEFSIKVYTTL